MAPEEELQRAGEAERLLAHPLIAEAFETIEREVIERWTQSQSADQAGREKLWLSLKLLHRIRLHLETIVQSGKLAEATLKQRALRVVGLKRSDF